MQVESVLPLVIGISLLSLAVALFLARQVLAADTGKPEMREISDAIREGAEAFLSRQYRTIGGLSLVAAAAIFAFYYLNREVRNIAEMGGGTFWKVTISFVAGALCSAIAGYIGMFVSIRANIRTAAAAMTSLNKALQIALRGGAVSGLSVVAMSLLGVGGLFYLFDGMHDYRHVPLQIVGFGFGASFVALFAQLGGGIYTKAADVGADLVGKVEAGIPEDDPRNPAVIADLVGDNVGWILFPLVVRAFGLIASMFGLLWVRPSVVIEPDKAAGKDPGEIAMKQLNIGYFITCGLSIIGVFIVSYLLLNGNNITTNNGIAPWVWFGLAGTVGILLSIAFVFITQYYTAGTWRPVREIAAATLTGPATTIITGVAVGFECVALPVLAISVALFLLFFLGSQVTIHASNIPQVINPGGIFGTAVATMGMLMSCAYILAMDTFGPITDNAGGITEMGGGAETVRDITDALDGVGNTTKALTKGYGIGSAALAAFLLFSAYLDVLYTRENHNPAVY